MLGKRDDALDDLKKAVVDSDPRTLDAGAWVVYGNMLHLYGFESTAAAMRERARSAKNEIDQDKWALTTLPSRFAIRIKSGRGGTANTA